ncbi:hypothetical protein ACFV20_01335 [Streptomyces sp. NPDC059696]|uniref:hypothetical protein n=1 Tax=Streptomyces sp. NPDC059696 TaxID=3346911 RepID=UPI0036BBF1EE
MEVGFGCGFVLGLTQALCGAGAVRFGLLAHLRLTEACQQHDASARRGGVAALHGLQAAEEARAEFAARLKRSFGDTQNLPVVSLPEHGEFTLGQLISQPWSSRPVSPQFVGSPSRTAFG